MYDNKLGGESLSGYYSSDVREIHKWFDGLVNSLESEKVAFGGCGTALRLCGEPQVRIESLTVFCTGGQAEVAIKQKLDSEGLSFEAGAGSIVATLSGGYRLCITLVDLPDEDWQYIHKVQGIPLLPVEVFVSSVLTDFVADPTSRKAYAVLAAYKLNLRKEFGSTAAKNMLTDFVCSQLSHHFEERLGRLFEDAIEEAPHVSAKQVVQEFREIANGGLEAHSSDGDEDLDRRFETVDDLSIYNGSRVGADVGADIRANRKVLRVLFESLAGDYRAVGPEVYLVGSDLPFIANSVRMVKQEDVYDKHKATSIDEMLADLGIESKTRTTYFGYFIEYTSHSSRDFKINIDTSASPERLATLLPECLGLNGMISGEPVTEVMNGLLECLIHEQLAYDMIAFVEIWNKFGELYDQRSKGFQMFKSRVEPFLAEFERGIHESAEKDERVFPEIDVDIIYKKFKDIVGIEDIENSEKTSLFDD